jgi:hypothetical protein
MTFFPVLAAQVKFTVRGKDIGLACPGYMLGYGRQDHSGWLIVPLTLHIVEKRYS